MRTVDFNGCHFKLSFNHKIFRIEIYYYQMYVDFHLHIDLKHRYFAIIFRWKIQVLINFTEINAFLCPFY